MIDAYFEKNKNRQEKVEYPFYIARMDTGDEEYRISYHWHYHAELLYFHTGGASIYIGGKFFKVSQGDIVMINPCEVHAVHIEKGEYTRHFVAGFDSQLLYPKSRIVFELQYLMPVMANLDHSSMVLNIGNAERNDVNSILDEAFEEYKGKKTGFELAVVADIYRLVLIFFRGLRSRSVHEFSETDPVHGRMPDFIKILAYINENFCDDISSSDITKIGMMSYSYFSKLFKNIMHVPLKKYLMHLRVKRSEQLLLRPELNITQIAVECGFSNLSYFIEQFKSEKGMSPNKYRKLLFEINKK